MTKNTGLNVNNDEELTEEEILHAQIVVLVTVQDEDQQDCWALLRTTMEKYADYVEMTEFDEPVILDEYGEILDTGWGITPTKEQLIEFYNQYGDIKIP